jgi:aminopeptidase N
LRCNAEGDAELTILKNVAEKDTWAIFNLQLSGLYKVKYDKQNWKLLIKTLISPEFKNIHTINRAQLIDDAMDLAWTGKHNF